MDGFAGIKIVLMFVLVCLMGEGALCLLYGRGWRQERTPADSVLTGGMVVIGLVEASHLAALLTGRPFSDCKSLFLIGTAIVSLGAGALLLLRRRALRRGKRSKAAGKAVERAADREAERRRVKGLLTADPGKKQEQIIFFLFGVIVLAQLLRTVAAGKVYPAGDMTAETVNTVLATDTLYQINPMTGQAYTQGAPLRLRILCLPTLYAILCELTGATAAQVVWIAVPAVTLLCCYLAYTTVARALFPEDGRKRGIFLILVAAVLWAGGYLYGMDGFGVQFAGYRGVSIRMAVLVPYTFGLILRRKWRLLPLCILAEACIVWTLYGMGACLFVSAAMLFLGMLKGWLAGIRRGEEDGLCGN